LEKREDVDNLAQETLQRLMDEYDSLTVPVLEGKD
jgi:hypothetical protein